MTTERDTPKRWSNWTIEIKVWKILVALIVLPILVLWYRVVHQDDEILSLVRNDVVSEAGGQRSWAGTFVNTNEQPLRDVAVIVDFLDDGNRTVGKAEAQAPELTYGARLDLQGPLPADAVRIRIYSVQWRMDRRGVLMGPFREPWEFGYLMAARAPADR
jgi:hypothetical protein